MSCGHQNRSMWGCMTCMEQQMATYQTGQNSLASAQAQRGMGLESQQAQAGQINEAALGNRALSGERLMQEAQQWFVRGHPGQFLSLRNGRGTEATVAVETDDSDNFTQWKEVAAERGRLLHEANLRWTVTHEQSVAAHKRATTLADKCQTLEDEKRDLEVENSRLRREVEHLTRKK